MLLSDDMFRETSSYVNSPKRTSSDGCARNRRGRWPRRGSISANVTTDTGHYRQPLS